MQFPDAILRCHNKSNAMDRPDGGHSWIGPGYANGAEYLIDLSLAPKVYRL